MQIGSPIYSDTEYARMLLKLFPQGDAFPRVESNSMWDFVLGLAQEYRRIDTRINALVAESSPEAADELIEEYEIDMGFPDGAFGIPATLAERRTQVLDREIFPTYLLTAWNDTGNTVAGSNVITGLANTTLARVGDLVTITGSLDSGKYEIIDKGVDSITIEQTLTATVNGAAITAYFGKSEQSERFYSSVANYYGCTITAFTYYGMCLAGVAVMGDDIGDYQRFTCKISFTLDTAPDSDFLIAFFDRLKPAGWIFIHEQV